MDMYRWMDSRQSLPEEHQRVCFIVMRHVQPLVGVYAGHRFHSRWGDWDAAQVAVWHTLAERPRHGDSHSKLAPSGGAPNDSMET